MRLVITGAGGRLGAVMASELQQSGHHVTALTRSELDITNPRSVHAAIGRLEPDAIVNCCAYNAVDAAEADPAAAFAVNAHGPAALADAAAHAGAVLVHFSSDFVFDGEAPEPYAEDAPANPLNVYGASKLAGEHQVQRLGEHYILRVESLFGGPMLTGRTATIDYIADNLTAGLTVRAMVDRTVSPSYVDDVVRASRALLERGAPFGTYHCVTSGCTTWYELACEAARCLGATAPVLPVRSDDFVAPAARPRFCAMSNRKLRALGIEMLSWRAALAHHLAARRTLTHTAQGPRAQIA